MHAKIEGDSWNLHSAGKAPFGNAADPVRLPFLFRRGFHATSVLFVAGTDSGALTRAPVPGKASSN